MRPLRIATAWSASIPSRGSTGTIQRALISRSRLRSRRLLAAVAGEPHSNACAAWADNPARRCGCGGARRHRIVQQSRRSPPAARAPRPARQHEPDSRTHRQVQDHQEIGPARPRWSISRRPLTTPEPVALKHVRFDDKARDEAKWNRRLIKLLKAERVVSGRLDHPNHPHRIHDASIEPDEAYVVMEYFLAARWSATAASRTCCPSIARSGSCSSAAWRSTTLTARASAPRHQSRRTSPVDRRDNNEDHRLPASRSTSTRSSTPTRPSSRA